MAATGDPLFAGSATYPSSSTYPGQGLAPIVDVLYSKSDATATVPEWIYATSKVRAWSTSRGRDRELSTIPAGTATITLDNRARTFDPTFDAGIRPLNRWWIRVQFDGQTWDVFKGYAESYDQQWPGGTLDAITVVSLSDEFKVLSNTLLPQTSPPRDTYNDVVLADGPNGYWPVPFLNVGDFQIQGIKYDGSAVQPLLITGGYSLFDPSGSPGHVISEDDQDGAIGGNFQTFQTGNINVGGPGDTGSTEFAIEFWYNPSDDTPAATRKLVEGPRSGGAGTMKYTVVHNTTGTLTVTARNSGGSTFGTGGGALVAGRWHHIVSTVSAGTLSLYVNGVLAASTAFTGSFGARDVGSELFWADIAASESRSFDHMAAYPSGLTATRVLAHYQAGVRGFVRQQFVFARVAQIFEEIVARGYVPVISEVTGWTMPAQRFKGQTALDAIYSCLATQGPDALFFISRSGTPTFLGYTYRAQSPYSSVQATFDDDGTDTPYMDVDVDYSEAFLYNEWRVTGRHLGLATAVDDASAAKYFKRSQALDLDLTNSVDTATLAAAYLAKFKDPLLRITSLKLTTSDPTIAETVFGLDLGWRIRVLRTPPGGGARIDQTLHVQKITCEQANDGGPIEVTIGVSLL